MIWDLSLLSPFYQVWICQVVYSSTVQWCWEEPVHRLWCVSTAKSRRILHNLFFFYPAILYAHVLICHFLWLTCNLVVCWVTFLSRPLLVSCGWHTHRRNLHTPYECYKSLVLLSWAKKKHVAYHPLLHSVLNCFKMLKNKTFCSLCLYHTCFQ